MTEIYIGRFDDGETLLEPDVHFHHPGETSVETGRQRVDFFNFSLGEVAASGLNEATIRALLEKDQPEAEAKSAEPFQELDPSDHDQLPYAA